MLQARVHCLTHSLIWTLIPAMIIGCSNHTPGSGNKPGTPAGTSAGQRVSVPHFNGERAFGYLTAQTDFGPRSPNSPGHDACLAYLHQKLRTLADEVRLQEFTHPGYGGTMLRLTNVIAAFRPEAASRILLCAHWDTRPRADQDEDKRKRDLPILGANDGASGVAVLLEIASLLKETPPPIGVDIVLFDGEDYGIEGDHQMYLLGSRHFAQNRAPEYLPRFGILLDLVGDAFLDLPQERYSVRYAADVVTLVWNTARELGIPAFLHEPGEEVLDDHIPLNEAGIKTINIIDFNYPDQTNRFWHTHNDIPAHCSPQSLEAVGTVVTHVLYTQAP